MEVQKKDNMIFAPLKNKWLVQKPEEEVRQTYICRLVDYYGYNLNQMGQEIQVNNSQRGQGMARADIVIWRNEQDKLESNSPLIVVECKAENVTIRQADYFQGYNYAGWAGADFFVTTNLKETRIFKVDKSKMPKELDEIADIPKADVANDRKKIQEILKQTREFTREEFTRMLMTCHNIIRNNDKLSPEAAFDEISKILFIKIRYERQNSKTQIFSLDTFKKDRDSYNKYRPKDGPVFYQFLFQQTKDEFKNDNLFEPSETIRIREDSFEKIVKELEVYNLSITSDDVKGIAFEKFLGKTFRGELGQFFTPRTIVNFMTEVLDPMEGELICDPCCGSGGFLIKAFEYVREKIENELSEHKKELKNQIYPENYEELSDSQKADIDKNVTDAFAKMNYEIDLSNPNGRLRNLSYNCIFGTDANPRMARTAKMNMIMHGDGHGGVHHHDGLLNVNGIWENRFDVILTNPPFGQRVSKDMKINEADRFTDQDKIKAYREHYGKEYDNALRQVNDNIGKPFWDLYETGKMSGGLTEVMFIERCINLLKPGGRMGIVLPEGVLNTSKLQNVREHIEGKAKILLIVSIPQDVFVASGATVKPSLLFFKKFTDEERIQYERTTEDAGVRVRANHNLEKLELLKKLEAKGKKAPSKEEKKDLKNQLKRLEERMAAEIVSLTKELFDYEIPIAEVKYAGISTTGAVINDELPEVCKAFTAYRKEQKLWTSVARKVSYRKDDLGKIYRQTEMQGGEVHESELVYGKDEE
ncbi:MAG: N-6 DNA methylase [Bacteroidales bacterium]|nr:N-6 DNA methylase [Bacteroidales bacterium]